MIGLDTNVLVRYLAQDDPVQTARATKLIERELSDTVPGYISLVVLMETCWVLKRLYGATRDEQRAMARGLLDARQLVVERRISVSRAIDKSTNGEFADALIAELAREAGCSRLVTFDKRAAKVGMSLLV